MGNFGLPTLVKYYGYASIDTFLEDSITDSICPGICPYCGYTIEVEPDCETGWCEECEDGTVVSGLILAGVI